MKLVINYDFVNAIKDVKEPIGPLKIIRNDKTRYIISGPLWFMLGNMMGYDYKKNLTVMMMAYGLYTMSGLYISKKLMQSDLDAYGLRSKDRLTSLVRELRNINVETTYDKLIQGEYYEHKIKIHVNENKIPLLMDNKYVLISSFGFDGKEKDTSILQEHVVGSFDYVLSVGEPEKQYRRVLVKA